MAFSELLFLLCLTFLPPPSHSASNSDCACQFTTNDPPDCKVYGKIDDRLIAWSKAETDCLDHYGIQITSIDPTRVGCTPPTNNVNSFVNAIKFESIPNSVRAGLGVEEGGFFIMENNKYVLKDSITVNGTLYNCDTSESDCYNAMKTYFSTPPGSDEVNDVCNTLTDKIAVDRELEQSTVRNQICTDIKSGVTPPDVCDDLGGQMVEEVKSNPEKDCSGFQFGPGTTEIPVCDGVAAGALGNSGADSVCWNSYGVVGSLVLGFASAALFLL